jgi:hypothetical protein
MKSSMHAEMFAMRKQSEFVVRPSSIESQEDNMYEDDPDSDAEIINSRPKGFWLSWSLLEDLTTRSGFL